MVYIAYVVSTIPSISSHTLETPSKTSTKSLATVEMSPNSPKIQRPYSQQLLVGTILIQEASRSPKLPRPHSQNLLSPDLFNKFQQTGSSASSSPSSAFSVKSLPRPDTPGQLKKTYISEPSINNEEDKLIKRRSKTTSSMVSMRIEEFNKTIKKNASVESLPMVRPKTLKLPLKDDKILRAPTIVPHNPAPILNTTIIKVAPKNPPSSPITASPISASFATSKPRISTGTRDNFTNHANRILDSIVSTDSSFESLAGSLRESVASTSPIKNNRITFLNRTSQIDADSNSDMSIPEVVLADEATDSYPTDAYPSHSNLDNIDINGMVSIRKKKPAKPIKKQMTDVMNGNYILFSGLLQTFDILKDLCVKASDEARCLLAALNRSSEGENIHTLVILNRYFYNTAKRIVDVASINCNVATSRKSLSDYIKAEKTFQGDVGNSFKISEYKNGIEKLLCAILDVCEIYKDNQEKLLVKVVDGFRIESFGDIQDPVSSDKNMYVDYKLEHYDMDCDYYRVNFVGSGIISLTQNIKITWGI